MRLPTILTDPAYETNSTETERTPHSNRRHFLKTMGIVGVGAGIALTPTQLLAGGAKSYSQPAQSYAAWLASCEDWRTCVQRFVSIVSRGNPRMAKWINNRLEASEIHEAPDYSGFHYRYAPLHAFKLKIDRAEVICGNGFMVDLFPYYGVDCTCESDYDLNSREMVRLSNDREMEHYNCVLAPAGLREKPDRSDHSNYRALRAKHYKNHNPEDFTLAYTRPYRSVKTGKVYTGYGLNYTKYDDSNTSSGDVLITKDV